VSTAVSHPDPTKLPTLFRACMWDDGWEFGAPGVVYFPRPYLRYGEVYDAGGLDDMLADILDGIVEGLPASDGGLADECEWRQWGAGFARRRQASHVAYRVQWISLDKGLSWSIAKRTETWGPGPSRRAP
jgi:hypothetical protein